jgi:Zn-dependent peptidase ImmA (M78 family)
MAQIIAQATEAQYISPFSIEACARRIIEDYDPSLISGEPRPIPIEEILELQHGIRIEFRRLRIKNNVLGCTVFEDGFLPAYVDTQEFKGYTLIPVAANTIVIDERLLASRYEGRMRFTLAHEFAHWLIHKRIYCGQLIAAARAAKFSFEVDSAVERQADLLAAALLLPKAQVKKAFYKHRDLKRLAEQLQVSQQVMDIFCEEHNLL